MSSQPDDSSIRCFLLPQATRSLVALFSQPFTVEEAEGRRRCPRCRGCGVLREGSWTLNPCPRCGGARMVRTA